MKYQNLIITCMSIVGVISCSKNSNTSSLSTSSSSSLPACTNISSTIPMCNSLQTYTASTICEAQIQQLLPAQSYVGELEIKYKLGGLNDAATQNPTNGVTNIVQDPSNLVPVTYTQGQLYIADKHHFLRSLSEYNQAQNKNYCAYVQVKDTLNGVSFSSQDNFWNMMNTFTLAYVEKNADGSYAYPATTIAQMPDDAFRSLAGYLPLYKNVNGKHIMGNSNDLFVQFKWADAIQAELLKLNPAILLTNGNFYTQTIAGAAITPAMVQAAMSNSNLSTKDAVGTLDGYLAQIISDDTDYKIISVVKALVDAQILPPPVNK